MKDKYYTPEIQEFFVGFEYIETPNRNFNPKFGWDTIMNYQNRIFDTSTDIQRIVKLILKNRILVKYLDKEDIEDCLGNNFKDSKSKYDADDIVEYIDGSIWDKGIAIRCNLITHNVKITQYHFHGEYAHDNSHQLFEGTIKNKSELKKILKMIGVK